MAKGDRLASERKFIEDEKTGAKIVKLTSFPTMHENLYMHDNCFTPDGKTLVFRTLRRLERGAPYDLFEVDTDGQNLVQITEGDVGGPLVSPVENALFFTRDKRLIKMELDSLKEEDICGFPDGVASCGGPSMTYNGKYYVAQATTNKGEGGAVRFKTDGSEAVLAFSRPGFMSHLQCEPVKAEIIAYQTEPDEAHRNIRLVDLGGANDRPLELYYGNGHWMWHGPTGRIMSAREFVRGVAVFGEGDAENDTITTLPAWHSGSSRDGKWVVSDTNWPDIGIVLTNSETKKSEVLCLSKGSNCHPQWTHPHPGFSPDAKTVVFKSDVTGHPDVYIVSVPDDMRERLSR